MNLPPAERLRRQIAFIAEVDKLKEIFRQTILTQSRRAENSAEHSWHLAMVALAATVRFVPGLTFDGSIWALAGIALVFGIVNAIIRPLALLLSAPLILLTVGVGALFVNGLMFWFVVWLVLGFWKKSNEKF